MIEHHIYDNSGDRDIHPNRESQARNFFMLLVLSIHRSSHEVSRLSTGAVSRKIKTIHFVIAIFKSTIHLVRLLKH